MPQQADLIELNHGERGQLAVNDRPLHHSPGVARETA